MAESNKTLAQIKSAANTLEKLYTVPASTQTVVSSVVVCNQSATATSFSLQIRIAGAGSDTKQYIYFTVAIPGNETFIATIGATLATTDEVWVLATLATLSWTLFGVEIT